MRNRFVKRWKQEEGLTLIELLAVLSLMGMILGLISTTIFFGFRSYNAVGVENRLREEGDILMSSIITELYVSAPDHVYALADGSGFRMVNTDLNGTELPATQKTVQIVNGQLEIRKAGDAADVIYQSTQTNAQVVSGLSSIRIEGSTVGGFEYYTTGLINIHLVLALGGEANRSQIELESRFGF
ncbi:prepilin-type N-terminal cleavage/methylation domain-containing protein [Saccharibacillus sacchari]|uniref:prepilin-type N-terminal cleavage/methylation domain-containing protein n=1 Tax=Saccharibacillus sacchari TaxID=456493 RepID=UPI0004B07038|nr:prepilin-type N-terminal cleavage/methylation domain-containing protein [Saccharibacillus sacchari]